MVDDKYRKPSNGKSVHTTYLGVIAILTLTLFYCHTSPQNDESRPKYEFSYLSRDKDPVCSHMTRENAFGQFAQDFFLWEILKDQPRGTFLDLAAAWPRKLSNTFVLENCLGWKGTCIDADPEKIPDLRAQRSCEVRHMCVTEKPTTMFIKGNKNTGTNALQERSHNAGYTELKCDSLDNTLHENVDFMSLDVEGSEAGVLLGMTKIKADILLIELSNCCRKDLHPEKIQVVRDFLNKNDYVPIVGFPDKIERCNVDSRESGLMVRHMTVDELFDHDVFKTSKGRWHCQDALLVRRDSRFLSAFQGYFECESATKL
mmetsp:Transcript_11681/g.19013  ORF Transcript_11681/g.19013 Transcript_11681/m.19013 type:complete len:316 (+) Transcript_11681:94-1041(+)